MKNKTMILLFLCLLPISLFAETLVGYRVIRTSPDEFLKLHRMNYVWNERSKNSSYPSRLTRFIKIKNKTVRQNIVKYEITPDVPILKEYFGDIKSVDITVTESLKANNSYDLNAVFDISKDQKINSRIEVVKHEQGALLKFFITDSTYSKTALNIFIATIRTFKFARETAEQASTDTMEFEKFDKNQIAQ